MKLRSLTFNRAHELLHYNAETGVITWRVSRSKAKAGNKAGVKWVTQNKQYIVVTVDSEQYFAHRIAWLLHTGDWPEYTIDHIDGCGLNNRIKNLRSVPQAENNKNKRPSKSDGKQWGVRWNQGRWQAQIKVAGVVKYLGGFHRKEDAIAARKLAERKYGFHVNHGVAAKEVE